MVVVVIVALSLFILPMFADLFADLEDLPLLTEIIMSVGGAIADYWYLILIGFFVLWLILSLVFRIQSVRLGIDRLKLRLPIFGKLLKKIYTARFSLTFSTLYAAGLSILDALQISATTVGNLYIENQFPRVISDIRNGQSLSGSLERIDGFSPKMISSIRVGEESGSLETMLDSMSDNLTFEADMAIDKMVALLEPLTILILALIVGLMVIGVMLPIADSYGSVGAGF
jgi:type IV pilus assembly protein PilC